MTSTLPWFNSPADLVRTVAIVQMITVAALLFTLYKLLSLAAKSYEPKPGPPLDWVRCVRQIPAEDWRNSRAVIQLYRKAPRLEHQTADTPLGCYFEPIDGKRILLDHGVGEYSVWLYYSCHLSVKP